MKPLPIGIQTFRDIIEGNYLYIDKTSHIYNMVKNTKGIYFLSRPRRFGKSLLISTLEEIFLGNKELFKGLWIYNSEYNWKKYPVIRFDFSKQKAREPEALIRFIHSELNRIAENYSITFKEIDYYSKFQELILELNKKEKVVILIDEYDKAIIDHLEDTDMAVKMREVMKGFFTVLKGNDAYIRFLFLTGVSKFSKAGVFSNLNQLNDITLRDDYSSMLGITNTELKSYFPEYISIFAKKENLTSDSLIDKIRFWYNGYKFSPEGESVYNPFSTLLLFESKRFQYHWFETGTPEFLVKLIIKNQYDVMEIPLQLEELSFSNYEVDDLRLTPLLLQTGYLTIKDYDGDSMIYTLDYPNFEVKRAFLTYFMKKLGKKEFSESILVKIIQSLKEDDIESCIDFLRELFLQIDYNLHIPLEKYYQTIFYLIFTLLGMRTSAEVKTNKGRIDSVIDDKSTFIFEFKLNGTKEEAIQQIKTKKYYEKYLNKGKSVYIIGVEFKDRNLGDYLVEKIDAS